MMLLFPLMLCVALGLGVSPVGRRLATGLPLWILVAAQSFRPPLELLMHQAYESGLMPVQMSYSALNFDILTGASAVVVALLLRRQHTNGAVAIQAVLVAFAIVGHIVVYRAFRTARRA